MSRSILFFISLVCTFLCSAQDDASDGSPLLPWTTKIDQAFLSAKEESLPIYLYVAGSTWCIWCKKMDKEIHGADGFRQKTVGKFIFLQVDLPAGSAPNEKTKTLLEKYHVKGVPTVLILSPEGEELGRFRYRQISPEEYANIVIEAASPVEQSQ